jgi:hypothetical protein
MGREATRVGRRGSKTGLLCITGEDKAKPDQQLAVYGATVTGRSSNEVCRGEDMGRFEQVSKFMSDVGDVWAEKPRVLFLSRRSRALD